MQLRLTNDPNDARLQLGYFFDDRSNRLKAASDFETYESIGLEIGSNAATLSQYRSPFGRAIVKEHIKQFLNLCCQYGVATEEERALAIALWKLSRQRASHNSAAEDFGNCGNGACSKPLFDAAPNRCKATGKYADLYERIEDGAAERHERVTSAENLRAASEDISWLLERFDVHAGRAGVDDVPLAYSVFSSLWPVLVPLADRSESLAHRELVGHTGVVLAKCAHEMGNYPEAKELYPVVRGLLAGVSAPKVWADLLVGELATKEMSHFAVPHVVKGAVGRSLEELLQFCGGRGRDTRQLRDDTAARIHRADVRLEWHAAVTTGSLHLLDAARRRLSDASKRATSASCLSRVHDTMARADSLLWKPELARENYNLSLKYLGNASSQRDKIIHRRTDASLLCCESRFEEASEVAQEGWEQCLASGLMNQKIVMGNFIAEMATFRYRSRPHP